MARREASGGGAPEAERGAAVAGAAGSAEPRGDAATREEASAAAEVGGADGTGEAPSAAAAGVAAGAMRGATGVDAASTADAATPTEAATPARGPTGATFGLWAPGASADAGWLGGDLIAAEPVPAPEPAPDPDSERDAADAPVVAARGPVGRFFAPLVAPLLGWIRRFIERHGDKLWWLHSIYALGLGATIVFYASKGLDEARWLVVGAVVGWLALVLLFRIYGSGDAQAERRSGRLGKIGFHALTYVLKNLFQGMLFFLLPFYWKSAVAGAASGGFVILLGILAILSTLDVVFDRVLMRFKGAATAVYFVILFAGLNLALSALFPDLRTLACLLGAAAIATAIFWTMHLPLRLLGRPQWMIAFLLTCAGAVFATYGARSVIPPVPMYVSSGAVGPALLEDGRLSLHVSVVHASLIQEIHALTDVVVPGGRGDRLQHVWRQGGVELQRGPVAPSGAPPPGTVRLRSTLRSFNLPAELAGSWSVDVETEDGQLVGRVAFAVIE